MALVDPAIVAIDLCDLHRWFLALPQHTHPVLNNLCSNFSLPLLHKKIVDRHSCRLV